jgi:hypothetical protein
MDHRAGPSGWDSPADRPTVVQVTVVAAPGRRARNRRPNALIAGLGTLPAIAVAATIAVLPGGGRGAATPRARTPATPAPGVPTPGFHTPRFGFPVPGAPSSQPPTLLLVNSAPPSGAVAGSYRFPLGCLSSILGEGREAGSGPCRRNSGYVTAILRRVSGSWRVTLKETNPTCPQMPLPAAMRRNVQVCRR